MEESLKRKERLKAMRSEAALASDPNVETSAVPGHLSNPLTETPSVQGESRAAPRFDFYTDPMAAFSDNRKRGKVDGQGGQHRALPPNASGWAQRPQSFPVPTNHEMNPRPVYQMLNNYSHRGPSPQPLHQGTPAWNEYRPRANYSNHGPDGSFQGSIRPPFNYPEPPRPWLEAMDAVGYTSPPNVPIDGNLPSSYPRPPGPPDFSHGPAMSRFGNNPMAGPVYRGGGRGGYGNNSGFGRGGGGRRGPNFRRPNMPFDGAPEPERFFNASMLQDPWQQLEPVVWRNRDPKTTNSDSSNSWLPPSISSKKEERVSDTLTQSSSRPSLAEYLATSFNKAVEDSPSESQL